MIQPLLKPSQMPKRPRWNVIEVVDGIERRRSKVTGEEFEVCLTPAATSRRRREIYERDGRRCVGKGCGKPLRFERGFPDSMHWHHKKLKSQGGGDEKSNGETLCEHCHLVIEHGHF